MNKKKVLSLINPLFLDGICHRGLHNKEYSENGLNAFKNALDHHMALELDVHLTKDRKIVVFHDSDTRRMTGREGIIEDLTLEQIKNEYTLLDGEEIPTLKEVFDLIREQVPIVLELKVYNKNYKELARYVKEELRVIKDKRNLILISFDPRALFLFKHEGYIRQLLVTTDPRYKYVYHFRHFFEGVDLEYKFMEDKKARKYCKKHFSNLWTIESEEVFDDVHKYADTVTFQLMDEEYVRSNIHDKK